jgi:hypothetical protein
MLGEAQAGFHLEHRLVQSSTIPVAALRSDWCGYSSPYFLVLPDKHPSIKKEFMGIL